jgi:flagellar protein FliJ
MARAFRLQVLLDLAQRRLDAATVELQRLRMQWTEAQQKRDQLAAYETEYASGLGMRLREGMPAHQVNDYRLFLDKLARALDAQGEEIERRRAAWEAGHARWLELKQRQEALRVLRERHALAEAALESRHEQKEQDEFALRPTKDGLPPV